MKLWLRKYLGIRDLEVSIDIVHAHVSQISQHFMKEVERERARAEVIRRQLDDAEKNQKVASDKLGNSIIADMTANPEKYVPWVCPLCGGTTGKHSVGCPNILGDIPREH